MQRTPVLFVDFDGVLHPFGEPAFDEDFRLVHNPRLFCWRSILENILLPHQSVRIIVSSDWRRLFDDENLVRLLGPHLGPRFIGVVESYRTARSEEIYAEALRRELQFWLALDDHPTVVMARRVGDKRFIACASDTGLSNSRVQHELAQKLAKMERDLALDAQ